MTQHRAFLPILASYTWFIVGLAMMNGEVFWAVLNAAIGCFFTIMTIRRAA